MPSSSSTSSTTIPSWRRSPPAPTAAPRATLLPLGDYYAVETSAPVGFELDAARHYVTLSGGGGVTVTIQATDTPIPPDWGGVVVFFRHVWDNTEIAKSAGFDAPAGTDFMPWVRASGFEGKKIADFAYTGREDIPVAGPTAGRLRHAASARALHQRPRQRARRQRPAGHGRDEARRCLRPAGSGHARGRRRHDLQAVRRAGHVHGRGVRGQDAGDRSPDRRQARAHLLVQARHHRRVEEHRRRAQDRRLAQRQDRRRPSWPRPARSRARS